MPDSALFPVIFTLLLLVGFCYSFTEVCAFSWTLGSVGAKDRTTAMATMLGGRVLGALLGPAIGGILYNFAGLTVPFAVGFILLIVTQEFVRKFFAVDDG